MATPSPTSKALASPAVRLALGVGGLGLVALLFYVLVYDGLNTQLASARNQETLLRKDLAKSHEVEAVYRRDLAELTEKQQHERELNRALPESADTPSFLSSIQSVANSCGVSLTSWDPLEEAPKDFYVKVPLRLKLTAHFHQILKFFYGIGQLDRIINVEDISLNGPKPEQAESDDAMTDAQCVATAFYVNKTQVAAKPGAPASPGSKPPAAGTPPPKSTSSK